MSDQTILNELREMETRLSDKIAANNREIGEVGTKVDDHVEWEMGKYRSLEDKVKCINEKVGNLRVEHAVTKTKVGTIGAIGGAIVAAAVEGVRRVLGS